MRSIKFNRGKTGKYSVHLLVMIIELSNFRRNFTDLPSFQVVPFVQNCTVVLLEFPKLNLFIEIKDFLRTPCVKTLFPLIPKAKSRARCESSQYLKNIVNVSMMLLMSVSVEQESLNTIL